MKKNIFITIYSIIVSIIFVGAVTLFGIGIFNEYNNGFHRTEERYSELKGKVKSGISIYNSRGFLSSSDLSPIIGSEDDFAYLIIKVNGNEIYKTPGNQQIPENNTKMIRLKFDSFVIDGINVSLFAALYTIRPVTISTYARTSFLIVLFFTILTIGLIIYKGLTEENDNKTDVSDKIKIENNEKENININPIESETQTSASKDSFDVESNNIISAEGIDSSMQGEFETYNIPVLEVPEENKIEENNVELPLDESKPVEIDVTSPSGLYSPLTGFCWETYLQTRLDNELVRASSSEFDMTLFIIKLQNIQRDCDAIKEISKLLIDSFQFKDMIFEYKDDSFAAIKTNMNIDDALPFADKLHTEISKIVNKENGFCYIGLSAKTIRMVSSERLLKEADAACEHASENKESPIIAFRVNTEKYMQFMDSTS